MDDFLLDLDTLASDTALHLAVQEAELYKKQSKILANRARYVIRFVRACGTLSESDVDAVVAILHGRHTSSDQIDEGVA